MKEQKKAKKNRIFSFRYLLVDFIRITAAPSGFPWFRIRYYYESEAAKAKIRGGALLIANHVSYMDPIYLMFCVWYRRHHFVCMKEFFEKGGLQRWFFKHIQCIPIDRDNFSMASFREITEHLKAGELVTIFPEGHIDVSGDGTKRFKSGMVMMALQSRCPVVPVYVKKKEHWYERLKCAIGEPVDVKALYDEKPSFTRVEEISAMLAEHENRLKELIG